MASKIVLSYADTESTSFQDFWGHSKASADKLEELRLRSAASRCPWCSQPAQKDEEIFKVPFDHSQSDPDLGVSDGLYQALWRCHCGWWMHQYQDGLTNEYHRVIQQGVLKSLDIASPEMPIDALNRHISDSRISALSIPQRLSAGSKNCSRTISIVKSDMSGGPVTTA